MNRHNFQTFKISNRSTPFFLDRESSEVSERVKQKFPGNPVSKILKKKKKKFERISRPQWRAVSPLSLVEAMLTFNLLMEVFLVSPSFFSFLSFFFFFPLHPSTTSVQLSRRRINARRIRRRPPRTL